MNRITLLSLIFSTLLCFTAGAQSVALTGFGGYTFQDRVFGYYADVIFRDGAHYGGVLSFRPEGGAVSLDLTYSIQPIDFEVTDYSTIITSNYTVPGNVQYIMAGVTRSTNFDDKVAPFGGFMLGAAIMDPDEYSSEVKFAFGLKLGGIIRFAERVGLVLQTQLMVPVQGIGVTVGCGTGGCGSGVSTSSSATQFGFSGGLEFKLK